jgi:hypothetical protein
MTDELLPTDEPGNPLMDVPPGFTDALMDRIAKHRRRERLQNRLRMAVVVLGGAAIVAGLTASGFLLARRMDDGRERAPQNAAGPGVPRGLAPKKDVVPEPSQLPAAASGRNTAVTASSGLPATHKEAPSNTSSTHDPSVALVAASASTEPQELVITIEDQEYRCPPDFFHPSPDKQPVIRQVHDGKPSKLPPAVQAQVHDDKPSELPPRNQAQVNDGKPSKLPPAVQAQLRRCRAVTPRE